MLQRTQRSVGFDHTRIDPQLPSTQESMRVQGLHAQLMHCREVLLGQPLAKDAQAGMMRRSFRQAEPKKARTLSESAQREAIARSLGRSSKKPTISILK